MPGQGQISEKNIKSASGDVYWHDGIAALTPTVSAPMGKAEVVIIGAGYTGLHAAIATARGGRSTQVIDMHGLRYG